ncbi:uncharacterized protein (DUF305 family) [Erythromicrobium ramosum]|uniref:DUF305 domain-containing protein n=1 Tax=Erythrobacter ramosus TaxID=35811 RepID=A0A6I4UIV9_9SPHN|nr:DUF305 domain-containing protein [Erythrobacter ramosus]MBB3774619.1 uncharacterized protein (DUF305 family) [Erythrobacter ramosus]MXP37734.1 DUF305 domain-containing protein [Erythrobacter ramosus]
MKAIVILAPAALVLLAACGADTDATAKPAAVDHSAMDHSGHDMGGETKSELTEAQAAYKAVNDRMHAGMADIPTDADVAFMQGMLAHHQGAVEMSEVALKYAKDEQARDLAARVIAAQKAEIAEMQAWLKARGVQ